MNVDLEQMNVDVEGNCGGNPEEWVFSCIPICEMNLVVLTI